jgi:hypothetical protein
MLEPRLIGGERLDGVAADIGVRASDRYMIPVGLARDNRIPRSSASVQASGQPEGQPPLLSRFIRVSRSSR